MNPKDTIEFFWVNEHVVPETERDERKTYGLAYRAVMEDGRNEKPKKIQIRSDGHPTTVSNGEKRVDPKGNHWTICYKGNEEIENKKHFTIHTYTSGPYDFDITETTKSKIKPDYVPKGNDKKCWPAEAEMHLGDVITVEELETL